ncbi:hypothetical protein BDZ94DRAFT_1325139 [Collybia nuda]|uniref:F-box domain-containing protein n=1 Tax=Collybia nuda TaxID=64659 RepID=A0A9P5Y0E4_9AGAR|nr:hypothetical protein BDZ94DRAFT_1325139 [Collybia nuda]
MTGPNVMICSKSSRTSIPTEIYLSIFDYVIPPPPIQAEHHIIHTNLCLVCRAFCQMLQPRIFRVMEFSNKKANKLIPIKGSQAFCVAVTNGVTSATSLAQHVIECTLRDWNITSSFHAGSGAPTCLWEAYSHTLTLLPNLRVLNMKDMCLDETMLRDICSLMGLQSLTLHSCIAARGVKPDFIQTLGPPDNLQHFYYKGRVILAHSIYLDILHRIINPAHLKTFHSASWNVTTAIFSDFVGCSALLELNLDQAVHGILLQKILTQSPRLVTLTLGNIVPTAALPPPLPTSCVPNLENLICPPSILSGLVPGRPLRKLIISGFSCSPRQVENDLDVGARVTQYLSLSGTDDMTILAQSSARIYTLRVPLQIFIAGVASCHFSSLVQLHLDFYHENYDFQGMTITCKKEFEVAIRAMCREIPLLSSLRTLTLSFGSRAPAFWPFLVDLVLQHRLITSSLVNPFPNVTTITFLTLIRWNKHYMKGMVNGPSEEVGPWSAEVLPGHYMVLMALGAAGCLKDAHDYGGVLRAELGAALDPCE